MSIKIVCDTASDLPPELADDLGVTTVPLHVMFGTTDLLDRHELSVGEFWERCAAYPELPQTAAPSPAAFSEAFEAAAASGAEGILCITLSSKISAANEAAQSAARRSGPGTGIEVRVLDSLSVTMGEGFVVLAAAEAAAAGADLDGVADAARGAMGRCSVFGVIDTLDNLRKGGRIGGARAALGTLLSVKPVIEVRGGVVEEESRQRTRGRSLRYLADKVMSAAPLDRLALMNAAAPDFGDLVAMLEGVEVAQPTVLADIGPVVSTHAGRGAIGAAWLTPVRR